MADTFMNRLAEEYWIDQITYSRLVRLTGLCCTKNKGHLSFDALHLFHNFYFWHIRSIFLQGFNLVRQEEKEDREHGLWEAFLLENWKRGLQQNCILARKYQRKKKNISSLCCQSISTWLWLVAKSQRWVRIFLSLTLFLVENVKISCYFFQKHLHILPI